MPKSTNRFRPQFIRAFLRKWKKTSPLQRRARHLDSFISYTPTRLAAPTDSVDLNRLRITWVIPDFVPGAGGHMTIFRIAHFLESFGHRVDFLIQNPTQHAKAEDALATLRRDFIPLNGSLSFLGDTLPEVVGDALIATDRFTCYPVNAMGGFIRKFYLVQDFEPSFYPMGSEYLLAEATYAFDFDCLCAGEWLHRLMVGKYGRWSMSWPLAYDPEVYRPSLTCARQKDRIAVYARYVTARRAVELIFLALDILSERGVEFEVDFFGLELGPLDVGYEYRDHGVLDGPALAELYRGATLGIVCSATNHSLVNKEMMACGLPVVDLDLPNVRAIFPEDCMAFASATPEGIATALQDILRSRSEQERLRSAGLAYVQQYSWENSARLIEAALKERIQLALSGGLDSHV